MGNDGLRMAFIPSIWDTVLLGEVITKTMAHFYFLSSLLITSLPMVFAGASWQMNGARGANGLPLRARQASKTTCSSNVPRDPIDPLSKSLRFLQLQKARL